MEGKKFQKSYFDVLGICCTSEVPLVLNILKPLEGVHEINVIVPSRTVIVVHDSLLISEIQIVKALNQARLEANIRVYGEEKFGKKWPSPYTIACGILVIVSTFKFIFHPLEWVGLGAVALGLPHILLRSIAAVRNCTLDVNILVLIAVAGTIVLRDYWEAGTIVFLFSIAEWLESRASRKANAVMSSLLRMVPQKAVLAQTGQAIDAKDITIDTVLAVKAGEVIPIDGVVIEGMSEVDEKTLTGESMPVSKQLQSTVWAGTINLNGYISVRTTALSEDCVVAKMAKLVEEAQNSKSRTQRLVDKFAKYYTPVVVLASVAFVVIPAALKKHDLKHWAHLALVILVSACPCALILSTPVATFCALTQAATTGVLIKGGEYLETLAKIKTLAFDKTGTITKGEFSVKEFRSISPDVSLNTLIYWVSSIESKASHPMAAALVDYGHYNSIEPNPENVEEFQSFPGEGVYGEIDGKSIHVGNRKIALRAGCETVPPQGDDTKEGETIGYVFSGANLVGVFSMADSCRSGVLEAILELKKMGIKTAMLTGDSIIAARRVQDQLGYALDEVHAELLPEEKVTIIKDLKKAGPAAMIGDGVNDAPALATADVGISMGISGSALATETGHITLLSNDIRKIPQAIKLARKTQSKVKQNVVLSVVTKAVILALAFGGHPLLWAAVLADVGTCLLVIFNSMLIVRGTSRHRGKHYKHTCAPDSNGHGSHTGCEHPPNDKHACGSIDVHMCSNSNRVEEQTCSHKHPPRICGHKEDQTSAPTNPCQTAHLGSCVKTSSCSGDETHAQCNGHKGCSTAPSHVIEIGGTENKEKACKNHPGRKHSACTKHNSIRGSVQVSCGMSKCSESSQHNGATQGHHEINNLDEDMRVMQVCEGHTHSHDKKHHDHHHQGFVQKDNIRNTSTVHGGFLHNEGIHVESTAHGGCLHNEGHHVECQTQKKPIQDLSNCIREMSNEESTAMHMCKGLDRREIGGCCRRYRRECGRMHGCHGSGMGGLSEIITE
ncbi:hypothetical protein IFM89_000216 [Coptis chinensis]|uniref:HMA domain-containing protein n=1 Tax=Coptis chinensis TaxID=261450 RepID=A0A835I9J5_9MAGN|nr:hypothetical protein IFM89_000216 [Coptis chinensis]